MTLRTVDLIARKRDGGRLLPAEVAALIDGYVRGDVPDYQMAAFAMAVLFRGMDADETAALLAAMQGSGDQVRWDGLDWPTADKHSTGGVGDKVSIPLAPAVAACGVAVPMISGRGLGHTGGTLDKLESIPGPGGVGHFETRLSLEQFQTMVGRIGVSMIGQTDRIVPADRKLYALRDVTATVPSIPLIVASILSKKLAEGVDSLVLDVKVGSGAFLKDEAAARELAVAMVRAAQSAGRRCTAWLTAMDRPLGTHIGNALEIVESVHILQGRGPADTRALVVRLGGEMVRMAGVAATLDGGEAMVARALDDGRALVRFQALLEAHGGDPAVADEPERLMPRAPVVRQLVAWRAGVVTHMDALGYGLAAVRLGAGRAKAEDAVDPRVGFVLLRRPGDAVEVGEPLVEVHAASDDAAAAALADLAAATGLADQDVERLPLFLGSIG
ncbi:MAG: thymidine phosphorylase [Myxococcales bacterium]|nr:thymidine phosphorylase [Myxococcales bacterium]